MKIRLILVAIFLGAVAYLSMHRSSPMFQPPEVTGDREAKVMVYLSCLGFSSVAAVKALKTADGSVDKVLTMTHMAVSGELSGEPPLTERGKTCLRSSGL